jgi:hypothetical protein
MQILQKFHKKITSDPSMDWFKIPDLLGRLERLGSRNFEPIYRRITSNFLVKLLQDLHDDPEIQRTGKFEDSRVLHGFDSQHNSIFLGRSASGPIGPPLIHFYGFDSWVRTSCSRSLLLE